MVNFSRQKTLTPPGNGYEKNNKSIKEFFKPRHSWTSSHILAVVGVIEVDSLINKILPTKRFTNPK